MRRTGAALIAFASLLLAGALARDALDRWIAAADLPELAVETGAETLDAEGRLLRAHTVADGRWRLALDPAAVDPLFLRMLIAWEDRRFARHAGVDPLALLRAAGQALRHGRIVSGGSTLSMQVARLIEAGGTGRWAGKLRQMRLALALERRLGKAGIVRLYLHLAPYGGNIEGLRAASLAWLGKPPGRLTPAEAALLVALPQAPEARRPDRFPEAALAARTRVLARAAVRGVIDADAARAAEAEPLPEVRRRFPTLAPHLSDRLRAANPGAARHVTTLDAGLQARLEALAAEAVAGRGAQLSAAIMVMEHASGHILAAVGSANYLAAEREGFVDMTLAPRSPGSTLKPLVYGLAFDAGLAHPETLIEDRPMRFGSYAPENFDRRYRGEVRVREALQLSLNLPVVALADRLGPAHVVAALRRAGVSPRLPGPAGLALVLGGVGLTLEDLVTLYAAIARGGVAVAPAYVPDPPREGARLLSRRAAWYLADILAERALPGGGAAGIAWKTGTSYGHRDTWAIGFDGRHVAGVWIGRPDGTPVPGALGAEAAAPVLRQVFARLAPVPLPPPPASALLGGNAALPAPLRRFVRSAAAGGPVIAFPPDGARLSLEDAALAVKLAGGRPPFTLLANGRPVVRGLRGRRAELFPEGPGFLDLTVIDAAGHAARSRVDLR